MSAHEVEILHAKQSFIVKVTNRVIISIFAGTIGIVWAIAYFCGGLVSEVRDHEKRITNIEKSWKEVFQPIANRNRTLYNQSIKPKTVDDNN